MDEDVSDVASVFTNDSWTSTETKATEEDRTITVTTEFIVAEAGVGWSSDEDLPLLTHEYSCSTASTYTLVRFELLNDDVAYELGTQLRAFFQVPSIHIPSIQLLNDGSWELLVQIAVIPLLRKTLGRIYRSFTLDEEYQPIDPRPHDVAYFGRRRAEALYARWFWDRAKQATVKGRARACYAYFVKQMRWKLVWRIWKGSITANREEQEEGWWEVLYSDSQNRIVTVRTACLPGPGYLAGPCGPFLGDRDAFWSPAFWRLHEPLDLHRRRLTAPSTSSNLSGHSSGTSLSKL